jgi:acetyl esterase
MLEPRHLPWRVRLIDAIARRTGDSVTAMDHDAIEAARGHVRPPRPPVSWVTGAVLPSVRIDARTATVDDADRLGGGGPPGDPERPSDPGRPDEETRPRGSREIGIRRYRPRRHLRARLPTPDALPMVVFFHGGGWAMGSVSGYDPLCSYLADSLSALVASVDYRLAPHHPAPAAADDALAATLCLWEHAAEVGGDPDRMAVCGDSAGGNLATVVAQALRDRAESGAGTAGTAGAAGPRLRHQALIYPSVDSTRLTPSKMARARGPIMTRSDTDTYLAHYLGLGEGALSAYDIRVSPALGRLDGLPPTLIQSAEFDPLRDEAIAYGEALEAAGVPVVSTTYAGAVHGFASFPAGAPGGFRHRAELTREIGRYLLA